MSIECDVLVVGAGPAGSSAARAAAKKGLKTILIEEHKEIGSPVQCAEGIGKYLFPYIPFKIPKEQLKWKINGMYFWANNLAIIKEGGVWQGYSINREKWDRWLASLAIKEGVEILTDTKFESVDYTKSKTIVTAYSKNKKIIFKPKYIIGADGVDSSVIDQVDSKNELSVAHIKSYEMYNVKLKYPRYEQLFFGNFAPGAYAYIFPKSKTKANIGVGTLFNKKELDGLFEKFTNLPIVKKQISSAKIINEKSGSAPIKDLSEKIFYKNIFLVGDAANQNIKPFVEGNIPGVICGDILGGFIHDIINKGENPANYERLIEKKFNIIAESQIYADILYKENQIDNDLFSLILVGLMSEIIHPDLNKIEQIAEKGSEFLREYIRKHGGFFER